MKLNFPHIPRRYSAQLGKTWWKIAIYLALFLGIVFNLVEEYVQKDKVLGEQSITVIKQEDENRNKELEKELNFWLNFKQKYPDYNYSYLKLADLYSKLNQENMSSQMWNKFNKEIVESSYN